MRTVDRATARATLERVFAAAADVERWPTFLPHYRWVTALERRPSGMLVEMAARRPFGPLAWPTWWVSQMESDPVRRRIRYRHVRGITTGMEVEWRVDGRDGEVNVEIVHDWHGPPWPWIGPLVAGWVIGPVFIRGIASRTLAGVCRQAER